MLGGLRLLILAMIGLLVVAVPVGCRRTPDDSRSSAPTSGGPWFEEVAHEVGIDFVLDSGHRSRYWFPEIIMPRTVCKRELTRDEAEHYLANKRTELLTDFTSRFGRPFSATLVLKETGRHGCINPAQVANNPGTNTGHLSDGRKVCWPGYGHGVCHCTLQVNERLFNCDRFFHRQQCTLCFAVFFRQRNTKI